MIKNRYIIPSVRIAEVQMVRMLCASDDQGSGAVMFSPVDPNKTTDVQL